MLQQELSTDAPTQHHRGISGGELATEAGLLTRPGARCVGDG
jgi:hypothetical protein